MNNYVFYHVIKNIQCKIVFLGGFIAILNLFSFNIDKVTSTIYYAYAQK